MNAKQKTSYGRQKGRGGAGYTLIEMLVVVLIIGLLLTISVVGVGGFFAKVTEAGTKQYLAAVAIALAGYEKEWGEFPPSDGAVQGAAALARLLLGKTTFPPTPTYLSLGNELTLHETAAGLPVLTIVTSKLKRPIVYYRAKPTGTIAVTNIWGPGGRFDSAHNPTWWSKGTKIIERGPAPHTYWMGSDPEDDAQEALAIRLRAARWLLVAAGGDDTFGTPDDIVLPGP